MTLRLGQLPDRTPVRMSLSVDPDLASALSISGVDAYM